MNYQDAKVLSESLNAEHTDSGRALNVICNSVQKTSMGLTSPVVKATPEYVAANFRYNVAAEKLRTFNKYYVKTFKKELAFDRAARYAKIIEANSMNNS